MGKPHKIYATVIFKNWKTGSAGLWSLRERKQTRRDLWLPWFSGWRQFSNSSERNGDPNRAQHSLNWGGRDLSSRRTRQLSHRQCLQGSVWERKELLSKRAKGFPWVFGWKTTCAGIGWNFLRPRKEPTSMKGWLPEMCKPYHFQSFYRARNHLSSHQPRYKGFNEYIRHSVETPERLCLNSAAELAPEKSLF